MVSETSRQQSVFESNPSMLLWPHEKLPDSHHGTEAFDCNGFTWPGQVMDSDTSHSSASSPLQQTRAANASPMPQWPSQLCDFVPWRTPLCEQQTSVVNMAMAPPPLPSNDGAPIPSRPKSNPRRTLTDKDRKRMCEYARANPGMKQKDIGRHFGVDRSTVSKILRVKDRFVPPRPPTPPPPAKEKVSRLRNVEKAMINWAKHEREKGRVLTLDEIASQAFKFSASAGGDNDNPIHRPGRTQKFYEIYVKGPPGRSTQAEDETLLLELRTSDGIIDTTEQKYQLISKSPSPWRDRSASVLSSSTSSSNLKRSPVQQRSYSSSAISTEPSVIAGFVDSDVLYSTGPSVYSGSTVCPNMYAFAGHAVKRARPITAVPTLVQASSMPSHFPTPEPDVKAQNSLDLPSTFLSPPQSTTQEHPSLCSLATSNSSPQGPPVYNTYWTSPTYETIKPFNSLTQHLPPHTTPSAQTISSRAMWQKPQDSKSQGDRTDRTSAEPRTADILPRLKSEKEKKEDVAHMALDYVKKLYKEKTGRALDSATVTMEELEKLFP
ncbi:hypothetical protein MBLNU457_3463t1 [Dothideomycetes sp. NU457]